LQLTEGLDLGTRDYIWVNDFFIYDTMQVDQLRAIVYQPKLQRRLTKTMLGPLTEQQLLDMGCEFQLAQPAQPADAKQVASRLIQSRLHPLLDEWIRAIATVSQQVLPQALRRGWSLAIDYREHFLLPFFPSELATVKTLPMADIWYVHEDHPQYMMERKSVLDISGARTSGSYASQKARLLASALAPHRITYLIEEDGAIQPIVPAKRHSEMKSNPPPMSVATLLACEASSIHRDGLAWRHSCHVLYTVLMIYKDLQALCKHQHWSVRYPEATNISQPIPSTHSVDAATRQELRHVSTKSPLPERLRSQAIPKDCPVIAWVRMLQQVHGMSTAKADAIQQKYTTLSAFIAHFSGLDQKARTNQVKGIKFQAHKRQAEAAPSKNIGPAVANRLLRIVFG
jgi:ERCC4-type nuclease